MLPKFLRDSLLRMAALIAVAPLPAFAAEPDAAPVESPSAAPATHVLFTGTDIHVQHKGALHRVRGVADRAFIIRVDGRNVVIPMGRNPERIKVARTQALTERMVTVTRFAYDRVYTPANDPRNKFVEQMRGLATSREITPMLDRKERETPQTRVVNRPDGSLEVIPEPELPGNQHAAMMGNSQSNGTMTEQFHTQRLNEALAAKLFDAIDVQFYVSAAQPIRNPYVVVTAKYHEKDDDKHVSTWLFATEIDPVDDIPRRISIREGGFPPGFEIENLQVHLYEKGVEIATDLSENRASLTRDEAHEYLLIEYLSSHKQATNPPQIALFHLPDDWLAHRHEAVFHKTYYVKVDKAGHGAGAFEDPDCATPVADPTCAEILNSLRFVPALEDGQPVDGLVSVVPASLGK